MAQRIRFYVDEHVSKAVVRGLRDRGVNVLTVTEAGTLSASDQDHIQRARDEGRTIFSQDNDFLRLHAAGIEHAGIVYAPQHMAIGQIVQGLMLIYQLLDAEEMYGHVEYL